MKKSLFWTLFTPLSLVLVICLIALAFYIPSQIKQNTEVNAITIAENSVQQFKILRAYYTNNVVKKVVGKSDIRASFNHKNEPDAIPLPATLIHDLSKELGKQGSSIKLYSAFPFPNRQERILDSFETEAWNSLIDDPKTVVSRTEEINGEMMTRVAVADTMVSDMCVHCHNTRLDTPKNDWKLGDVRGVLEVGIPIGQQLAAGQSLSNNITGILATVILLIFVVLYVLYQRTIGSKLDSLSFALQDIAEGEGDLTQRLDETEKNELGQVAHWFNVFMEKLQNLVREVDTASKGVAVTSDELSTLSSNTHSILHVQSTRTTEVACAMSEMTATVMEVARYSQEGIVVASQARQEADDGCSIVGDSINVIQELTCDVEKATVVIQQLESDTDQIGSVLGVIRDIAEQTNLLALNAAIEAARAGEQGRGFAVVADEVRALASRTQQSTQEIQAMIERLQQGSRDAAGVMKVSREQAQAGAERVAQAGTSLEAIVSSIQKISDFNIHIANATKEQTQATSEVDRNITEITTQAENAKEGAEKTASSGDMLTQQAAQLQKLVNRFKL
ncbi:MAG: methyl-accepting chemotaxis protein [Gammaproteobacteria bacterium]|nr:methyl-accepting chemotaxis protein [Gammaproteobacteria bacterium]